MYINQIRGSIHTQLATRNVNWTFLFHTHPPTLETSIRGKRKTCLNTRKYLYLLLYYEAPLKTTDLPSGEVREFVCFVYFPWLGKILYRFVVIKCVLQIECYIIQTNFILCFYNIQKCQTATGKTSKKITHTPTNVKLTFLVASWVWMLPLTNVTNVILYICCVVLFRFIFRWIHTIFTYF